MMTAVIAREEGTDEEARELVLLLHVAVFRRGTILRRLDPTH